MSCQIHFSDFRVVHVDEKPETVKCPDCDVNFQPTGVHVERLIETFGPKDNALEEKFQSKT